MIPEAFIEMWKSKAPWQTLAMVEQDMVITRALVELYSHPDIKDSLAFRGGTALNKLYINPPSRYSEDIDLVQIKAEPIGKTIDAIRDIIEPLLGKPIRKQTERSIKLIYKYESVDRATAKLKIEVNTTEHFSVKKNIKEDFGMESEWFSGKAQILTYELEELMATKLRALYQRRKGRDLFDLWLMLKNNLIDIPQTILIFKKYCKHNNEVITKPLFIKNLEEKRNHKDFSTDMNALLAIDLGWDFNKAFNLVNKKIISEL